MGCSASVETACPKSSWPTRTQCCNKIKEQTNTPVTTPRNWTSLAKDIQQTYKKRKLLDQQRLLFIDSLFPPKETSIGSLRGKIDVSKIVWKRPHDMALHPVLISDGTSRHDMKQGDLNDCWFLSTLSLLADKPQLISKIIPKDISFGNSDYDGSFICRFWQFGEWVEVKTDDLLPTIDGNLVFARSSDPSEFWVSLVEKAYAKLNKSYAALEFGFEADAYTDLTGGLAEWYTPGDLRENDFYLMRAAFQCGAVIGCLSVDRADKSTNNNKGMVSNHSYVVTAVEEVPFRDSAAKLIRMRNPWGDTEWQGEWCDGGDEWKRVPENVKAELEVTTRDDGEFWMSFEDFRREYCNMIICNMSPDFDHDGISDKAVCQLSLRGRWESGINSGGWIECDNFHVNPQYHLVIHSEVNVLRRYNGRMPLVVALLQIYRRGAVKSPEDNDLLAIGFEIFQLPGRPNGALDSEFFKSVDPLMPENEETYAKYRETSGRFFLVPGHYLLVPSTHVPAKSRNYLMRLFAVGKTECVPLGNTEDPSSDWP